MASVRPAAVALIAAALVASPAQPSARPARQLKAFVETLTVVVVERDAWQRYAERTIGGVGLGVFPDSRDPARFLDEIGRGGPSGGSEASKGAPGSLGSALAAAGLRVAIAQGGVSKLAGPLGRAFSVDGARIDEATPAEVLSADVAIAAPAATSEVDALLRNRSGRNSAFLLIGSSDLAPLWIELCFAPGCQSAEGLRHSNGAVLEGGIARRPGIVTPYDLAATMVDLLGAQRPDAFAGSVLHLESRQDALGAVRKLAARLERDSNYAPAVAATTVTLCILALFAALMLARAKRRDLAIRAAQAGAMVVPGWIVSQFVPTGRADVRALVVAGAAVLGAAGRPREPARAIARVCVVSAIAFAVLASIAPLRPGGEPGLSIWGNPLVSWRFFGLQNVQAAMIALGVVVWGVLAGLRPAALAATAAAAAVIVGAPTMGANFVGVLTFVFGASAAVLVLARRRFEWWHFLVSGVLAVGAFAAALAADAGSPVSHGGRAARSIAEGGVSVAFDLVRDRMKLNLDLIGEFSGGYLWAPGVLLISLALIAWGLRVSRGPLEGRAAILGGGLMAMSSLVLEDSGFYSGAVLMAATAAAFLLVRLSARQTDPPGGGG